MFITWASAWLGISYVLYVYLFGKKSDQEKIDIIFRNVRFCLNDQYPERLYAHKKDMYDVYGYTVPYGLTDNDKLGGVINKTINKSVELSMDSGHLKIKVYKEYLKTLYKYDWKESGKIPIGHSQNGVIYHDFEKIPHMTIAGMTRQGKTVLLKLILAHLVNNNDSAEIHILDLKGGLEFNRYRNIKQIYDIADDLPSALSVLNKIIRNMDADMTIFKREVYNNIVNTSIKRRTFIIVDEAAELDKSCQGLLSKIARIGGALGYRLIFATQYPTADTLPRQIKQNADAKISFRLPTGTASRVAIDENGAEELPCPGRAIYRTHERHVMQVPYVSDEEISDKLRRFERNGSAVEKGTSGGKDIITFE